MYLFEKGSIIIFAGGRHGISSDRLGRTTSPAFPETLQTDNIFNILKRRVSQSSHFPRQPISSYEARFSRDKKWKPAPCTSRYVRSRCVFVCAGRAAPAPRPLKSLWGRPDRLGDDDDDDDADGKQPVRRSDGRGATGHKLHG